MESTASCSGRVVSSALVEAASAARYRSSLESLWSRVTGLSVRVVQATARAAAAGYSSEAWSAADSAAVLQDCGYVGDLLASLTESLVLESRALAECGADSSPAVHDIQARLTQPYSCEAVLLALSDVYTQVRCLDAAVAKAAQAAAEAEGLPADSQWAPPDEFKRSTTKYWVAPENVMRVQAFMVRHLPLLVFGRKEGGPVAVAAAEAAAATTPADRASPAGELLSSMQSKGPVATGAHARPSSRISSVYFDRLPTLDTYHTRIMRDDGARLVRIRWYGDQDPTPQDAASGALVYVERKTHREKWSGEESSKDRAPLPLSLLPAYLAGQPLPGITTDLPADATKRQCKQAQLLVEVQAFLMGHEQQSQVQGTGPQQPVLRTDYRRAAFQRSDTNEVRVSLDMQMELACELQQRPGTRVSTWCQAPQPLNPLPPGPPTVHFPYAVLEIKLADKHNKPEWVKELLASSLVVEATKFSKCQHASALLYPTLLRNTPHWFVADTLSAHGGDHLSTHSGSGGASHSHSEEVQVFRPATLEEARQAFEASRAEKAQHKLERSSRRSSLHDAAGSDHQQQLPQPSTGPAVSPLPVSSSAKWQSSPHVAINIERTSHSSNCGGTTVGRRNPAARLVSLLRLASLSSRKSKGSKGGKGAAVDSKGNLLPVASSMARARVEPKTFFSAERSFLAWINIAVLVMLTSLSLMAVSSGCGSPEDPHICSSVIAGAVMAPLGLSLMVYALWMYRWRTHAILHRLANTRYDDQNGPIGLVAVLVLVMFVSYGLTMHAAVQAVSSVAAPAAAAGSSLM